MVVGERRSRMKRNELVSQTVRQKSRLVVKGCLTKYCEGIRR